MVETIANMHVMHSFVASKYSVKFFRSNCRFNITE